MTTTTLTLAGAHPWRRGDTLTLHLARECTGSGDRGALAIEHQRAYGVANRLLMATIFAPAPEATE